MIKERGIHAVLSGDFLAPIRSDSPSYLIEVEEDVFRGELEDKAVEFGIALRRLVSCSLMPASMVVMENFAEQYADQQTAVEIRKKRIQHQYLMGAMIGLTAIALASEDEGSWLNSGVTTPLRERHPDSVVSFASLVQYDKLPDKDTEFKVDHVVRKIVDELIDHTTADLEDPEMEVHATRVGYFAARQLASLSLTREA